jgi:hypothetical protein
MPADGSSTTETQYRDEGDKTIKLAILLLLEAVFFVQRLLPRFRKYNTQVWPRSGQKKKYAVDRKYAFDRKKCAFDGNGTN